VKTPFLDIPEVHFSLEVVRKASLLAKQVQKEMITPTTITKSDRSPVTIADLAAQAVIAGELEKAFPKDPLLGEEDSTILRSPEAKTILNQVTQYVRHFSPMATPEVVCDWIDRGTGSPAKRFWTLDPIDGTKGFLRGDQYAVALALIVNGKVEIGVLGCPNLREARIPQGGGPGSLVIAVRGKGAWTTPLDGREDFVPLRVSNRTDPAKIVLLRSFDTGHTNADEIEALRGILGIQASTVLLDSLAKYSLLAAGGADLYFRLLSPNHPNYRECIWDQASGTIILEEAGGRVTDLDGKILDFTTGRKLINNRGVLASNSHVHSMALDALRKLHSTGRH
jgi:3'(2'), 5'-bisphosphate nucleotidase